MKTRTIPLAIASIAAALTLLATPSIAAADTGDDDSMQQRIDAVLEAHPDGVQIDANEVSFDGGKIVLTLAATPTSSLSALIGVQPLSVGSCASGYYCVWSSTNYGGNKLSLSGCLASGYSVNLTSYLATRYSAANNKNGAIEKLYNSSGTLLYSLGYTVGNPNTSSNPTKVTCFTTGAS